jgi:flagellar biogenesis protein FliO
MRNTKLIFVAVLVAAPLAAAAEPALELIDRGEALEVIARDVKAARTAIVPTRTRLEVELVGFPVARALAPKAGSGVTIAELTGSTPRMMSIKLPLEREAVKRLARHAQAIQVGPDLHILFPRVVPSDGVAVELPEPTIPVALEKQLKPPPPADKRPAVDNVSQAAAVTTTQAAPTTSSSPPASPLLDGASSSSSFGGSMAILLAAAAIGLGIFLIKRKRATREPASSIDVVAQRSLGAKARVVWLSAGGRDMVVAVTPQQVRMLGQWPKGEPGMDLADAMGATMNELPTATALASGSRRLATVRPATHVPNVDRESPVAGILRLRARTQAPVAPASYGLDSEIATDDPEADSLWAKEIIAATTGAPRARARRAGDDDVEPS